MYVLFVHHIYPTRLAVSDTAAVLQSSWSRHLMFICTAQPVWRRRRNLLNDVVDLEAQALNLLVPCRQSFLHCTSKHTPAAALSSASASASTLPDVTYFTYRMVGWSLTSLFSINTAMAGDGGRSQTCAPYMGTGRGWFAGDWPSTGGVLNITAAAWTAGFHWWRSGNK